MATYGDCVNALRGSLSHLEGSVSTLGAGVADFPRLANVLKTVRHYELIPQPTLAAAESSLRDEIGPAISILLDRADTHIDRVERRIESLKARADLQQGRLASSRGGYGGYGDDDDEDHESFGEYGSGKNKSSKKRGATKISTAHLGEEARLKARVVRQRKEALQYSVERLELQVLQKERELRKQVEHA
ncbi:uncharacterized protein PG998_011448 [Apiospora kogelbergensis]|uniref:DASH complex subunit SPC19 n=1 Tax=Apiospora kogelbergensis TaxID=1337665 RepID=A0AAW0RBK2_9PEZI